MAVKEVKLQGNLIITIPMDGLVVPYKVTGMTKKDCHNQFYAFVNRLRKQGKKIWYPKPTITSNEIITDSNTGTMVKNAYGLSTTVYLNPIIHNIKTNERLTL